MDNAADRMFLLIGIIFGFLGMLVTSSYPPLFIGSLVMFGLCCYGMYKSFKYLK